MSEMEQFAVGLFVALALSLLCVSIMIGYVAVTTIRGDDE